MVRFSVICLIFASVLLTGCGDKSESGSATGSSSGKEQTKFCDIAQQQMRDSAKIIAGCQAYVSMPNVEKEHDRYGEEFRRINAYAVKKCYPNFKDGDKWPPLIEAVKDWQIACYSLMLVMNESSRNKFPAHALADQFDKRVREVKQTEGAIKKYCPDLSIVDMKPK